MQKCYTTEKAPSSNFRLLDHPITDCTRVVEEKKMQIKNKTE
ncbi:6433_t:CDS:2, partial [Racocetra fulgida]